ncbi:hypothetical protein CBR_g34854 [Chara braunii]|uniref:Integrase catalytic domain-containing protein n=1 Tax=Chara braunii TaxID=69332 RepID=A0A388LJI3_CHABU|nr:hypothetical protein CBR_g34854 [Chara braunii]|eukprot:GBG82478.1 hypothetical protein CBR_g34854 [Chara braunii]
MLNGLEIAVVEAESVVDIVWDQLRGRGSQINFILENDERDRVNATTRLGTAGRRINHDTIIEEVVGSFELQAEPEVEEPEKVYGKPREEEPANKVTAAKKKFRYQIPILTLPELDDTFSKLLGTMVSVSFQTMLQARPRLLKGLRQLLTRRRVEIGENLELPEGERAKEAPQEVANLQRSHGDLEDLEKAFANIPLSLPDREAGEVMRSPPGTELSFHALPVGKLKIQIGTHHTDALVDGGAEITLIRRDFATITGCTVNKQVTGSIRGAGGEIPFAGYVTKCAVKAGVRESIWSFQRMTVMEEMDHDIILGRPWCANVEMIGMHLYDGSYMVDIKDPVTGRGELLRLLGTGGDPSKGKLATWSPSFEDSTRKGVFARMEGMRERVEIMIEEAFNKKEWIKMGLPQKKRRQEDEVLGVMAVSYTHLDVYKRQDGGYILDARDNLSGFVEAVVLKKKTGRSVTDWIEDFYLKHPFVRKFIADNETNFVNQEILGMLKRLCVPIKLIEPYHPEANAPVERGHRTLKNTIAKLAADHLGNWPRYLKQAVFAENMTPKRTTECIPTELSYKREIGFPVEALVPTWNRLDDDPQMTTEELIEAKCQQNLKNEEAMEYIANRVLDNRMRDKART